MKKYSTCSVQYHVQFQGMTEQQKSCFSIKALHKQWKKNATRSVYDCTVEDVEYICNKLSFSDA